MKKQRLLEAAVLIALFVFSAACTPPLPSGGTESPVYTSQPYRTDNPPAAHTIRFACLEKDRGEFESLAADFHAQEPAIQVEVLTIQDLLASDYTDELDQLLTSADVVYDLVDLEAALRGWTRDLSPFIEQDPTFEPEDFFPGMLEAFEAQGGLWALPASARLNFLFFDKQKFDEVGVPYPAFDWTKEDFLAAAKQLTRRREGEVVQYGFVDSFSSGRHAFVLPLLDNWLDRDPPLDAPAVVEAVRWYTDLALRHEVMPDASLNQEAIDRANDFIATGRAAMWSYRLDGYEPLRRENENIGIAPLPTNAEPGAEAFLYGYMMSAGTKYPQESWRWLRFLSRQRLLGRQNRLADRLPARRSVAEQSGYWDRFDEETLPVIRYAAEHLLLAPATSEKKSQLDVAIDAVFAGKPVEEALAEAQAALEEHLVQAAQATPAPLVVATPQPTGAAGATSIAFAPPPGAEALAYRALANTFHQAHPEVEVQIVSPDQMQTADCFAGNLSMADPGPPAGRLNLQPLWETDPAFPLDDFYPCFLDAFRFQGDLWGLPTQAQVRVIFYNRDLFDAAGVPYPTPGWTMADFLARAVALTRGIGAEKQYGFLPFNGDASDLPVFVALQGAVLWDEKGRPRFDAPDVVAAVRWYTDLALTHGVMPIFPQDLPDRDPAAQETRNALVREGRAAMWTDFSGIDRNDVWPAAAQVGMAPLPVGAEGVTEFLYEGLFIAADTPHPQACWEWLKFVSGQAELVRGLPARRSLFGSTAFAGQVGREAVETYRASLDYADLYRPATLEASGQLRWLYRAVADILTGTRPEVALAEAQRQAER